jgi:hypothetical protein
MPDELGEHWVAPFASDVNFFDRRADGLGALYGAPAVAARVGDRLDGTALVRTDWASLVRHSEGWFAVVVLGRDGVAYVEILGNEPAGRGRFAELVEDPEAAATLRLAHAFYHALNRRDRAAAEECFSDDFVVTDHRPIASFDRIAGAAAYIDLMFGAVAVADDLRWYAAEPLEHGGKVGRGTVMLAGHLNDGGGWAELVSGLVYSRQGDRFVRLAFFSPEAIEQQEALVAELKTDTSDA